MENKYENLIQIYPLIEDWTEYTKENKNEFIKALFGYEKNDKKKFIYIATSILLISYEELFMYEEIESYDICNKIYKFITDILTIYKELIIDFNADVTEINYLSALHITITQDRTALNELKNTIL